jgi:hypothetical protein
MIRSVVILSSVLLCAGAHAQESDLTPTEQYWAAHPDRMSSADSDMMSSDRFAEEANRNIREERQREDMQSMQNQIDELRREQTFLPN